MGVTGKRPPNVARVTGNAMTIPLRGPATRLRPAVHLTRACFASAAAVRRGHQESPAALVRELYGDDEPTRIILRGAVDPMTIGSAGAIAAAAVGDFVGSLEPYGAAAQLIAQGMQVNMTGVASVSVPRRVGSPDPALAWVAEAGPIPIKDFTLDSVELEPRKIAIGGALTREDGAARACGRAIVPRGCGRHARRLHALGHGRRRTRPPGLLAGIASLTPSAAGGEAATTEDLTPRCRGEQRQRGLHFAARADRGDDAAAAAGPRI